MNKIVFYILLISYASIAVAQEKKLDTVVVSARPETTKQNSVSKLDVDSGKIPRSISTISEERIQEQGVQNVQDALVYSAGVYGATYGFDTRGDWSFIRGTSPTQFQDGLKSLFGFYNNTRPNPYALSSIEILKGPAAVQYGQGSTGGIINLNSKLAGETKRAQVFAEYGSFDRIEAGTDLAGSINESETLFYRLVTVVRDSKTQVNFVDDNSLVFNPSLTWMPTPETKLTALFNWQENESGTSAQFLPWQGTVLEAPNGPLSSSVFASEPGWDRYDTEQRALTLFASHKFNDSLELDARARFTDSIADYRSLWPAFPPTFEDDGQTVKRSAYQAQNSFRGFTSDTRLKGRFKTGAVQHTANIGLDGQNVETTSKTFFGEGGEINLYMPVYGSFPAGAEIELSDPIDTKTRQTGVYIQDHMEWNNFALTLGARHDTAKTESPASGTSQSDNVFTKSAGLLYGFDNGISPYVSYAESFNPVIGNDINGNAFDPLEGTQYEAGVKYRSSEIPLAINAAVFTIKEENRLTPSLEDPNFQVQTGETDIDGFELEAQALIDKFEVIANYTYTEAEVEESNSGNEGVTLASVPETLASGWLNYLPLPEARVGAGIRYVGHSWDGSDSLKTPAYTLVDASASYQYENLGVNLFIRNAFDRRHVTTCLSRGDCFFGEERTIILNLTYDF